MNWPPESELEARFQAETVHLVCDGDLTMRPRMVINNDRA